MTTPSVPTTPAAAGAPRPAAPPPPDGSPSFLARAATWNWPVVLLVGLIGLAVAGAVLYPTYTNYDSTYSLIWGRELLHGQLPSFDGYRHPTQHPLTVLAGAFFALFGDAGDRLMTLSVIASFVVLVAMLYRLGRIAFTPLVGIAAGVILCTRFDFPFLAARAYLDIPYLALIVAAAALEAARPRRGVPVLALLALAGLLRPEAWVLAGLYWLYLFPKATWRERLRDAALVAAAPLVWTASDWIVTGDPLFSHTHTSGLAEELGRQKGISEVPGTMVEFLKRLVKLPVALAGLAGLGLALALVPTRIRVPLALLLAGLGTFLLVGLGGLSVISRYLLAPSLMVMLFAAFALAGFTVLRDGRLKWAWAAVSVVVIVGAGVWTATRVDTHKLTAELRFRGESRASLRDLLDDPKVLAAVRCGPVTTPNHKLVPDVRWILDLPRDKVIARSDRRAAAQVDTGVAILAGRRSVLVRQGFNPEDVTVEDTLLNLPPPGYERIAVSPFYSAYARCT